MSSKLEQFIYEKMSQTRLPSVSAALIHEGQVVWSKSMGFRNLEHSLPATPETLYCVGSVTKSFTAMAIMQLVEQGKLSVDDPIDQYLPFNIKPFGENIRIWHLLSHTSGIPGLGMSERIIGGLTGAEDNWLSIASSSDLMNFMSGAQDWVAAKPGERWFYLNEGYMMLGAVIEKCSGMGYYEYVKKNILEPLGMKRSTYLREDVERDGNDATPYVTTDEGKRIPSYYPYGVSNSRGGLVSNVLDLAKYVSMYLANGTFNHASILSPAGIEEMETPRIMTPLKDDPFGDNGYAYGLRIQTDFLGHKLVQHGGSVGTATAFIGFIPEKNVGVAVLANASGYQPSQMGLYGLAVALGENPDDLPFVRRENDLSELTGNYETFKGTIQAKVKKAGDLLSLVMGNRYNTQTIPLIPVSIEKDRRVFYTLSSGNRLEVEFLLSEDKITLLYERYAFRRVGKLA